MLLIVGGGKGEMQMMTGWTMRTRFWRSRTILISLIVFLLSLMFFSSPSKEVFYYESINRELKRRPIYECRSGERLKTKAEGSTRLT